MKDGGVRLSGGIWRGRHLAVPDGARPSSARLREALLSRWQMRLVGADLLDLFAGSGAVGLEALGRGARRLTLVEVAPEALRSLRSNLALLGAGGSCELMAASWEVALPLLAARAGAAFDLVFADPPYAFANWPALLAAIAPVLRPGGELAVEHDTRRELPEAAASLRRREVRAYGESRLAFFAREAGG